MWTGAHKQNFIAFIVIGNYHIMWTKETIKTPTECINTISMLHVAIVVQSFPFPYAYIHFGAIRKSNRMLKGNVNNCDNQNERKRKKARELKGKVLYVICQTSCSNERIICLKNCSSYNTSLRFWFRFFFIVSIGLRNFCENHISDYRLCPFALTVAPRVETPDIPIHCEQVSR